MSGQTPIERKPILRVSETSKYFGKKKFKAGDYTKTDSQSRICLFNKNHRFIRYLESEPLSNVPNDSPYSPIL